MATPASPLRTLGDAVAEHVRPGDRVQVALGHHRWTAAARELARQHWGTRPGPDLELVMASLGSMGTLLVAGGLLRHVVTAYSGDAFPTYSPNPIYQRAYAAGRPTVEHWSFLTLVRRLEAAAAGLPAAPVRPLSRTTFARENPAYFEVDTPAGPLGLVSALAPDVTLLHAVAADTAGNLVIAPPMLDGVAGAFAARRGVVATVERVVADLTPWSAFTRIPAHRVLAVVEAPFGAHPGGVYGGALGLPGYAEDIPFWSAARDASRQDFAGFARQWCLEPTDQAAYLDRLGRDRLDALVARLDPLSWQADAARDPVDEAAPASAWETAAAWAARELESLIDTVPADAVLAGAGVANLAAWSAVGAARARGSTVHLTAELGLWGYTPTPADPFIFNFRTFPGTLSLSDAVTVLATLVGGPGTRTLGCLGCAQVDSRGDLNSTRLADSTVLVGAGGGTDVALGADQCVVVTLLRPERTPAQVPYVTSPGDRVSTVVTDLGILRRQDGELRLAAVPGDAESGPAAVRTAVASCGWPLPVAREVHWITPPAPEEILRLRRFDPRRLFLGT
ncbi:MAG: CoA-transferase [Mycobacteriales bacterium]